MLKQFIGGEWIVVGGGGGGSSDYDDLTDKPQINSHTLSGNKSSSDLGLQDVISDLETIRSGAGAGATAVQPAAMEAALSGKQDEITDIETIRSGAGAGATAIQTIKINGTAQTKTDGEVDLPAYPTSLPASNTTNSYSSSGTDPISGQGVAAAIGTLDVSAYGGTGKYIKSISETNGKISPVAETMDTTPTASSTKAVTSGGVQSAIASEATARQNADTKQTDALVYIIDNGPKNVADWSASTQTITDVTFTVNDADRTVTTTASGAAAARRQKALDFNIPSTLPAGQYVLSGCPAGGAVGSTVKYCLYVWDFTANSRVSLNDTGDGVTFDWIPDSTHQYNIGVDIRSGTNPDGLVFKPMICLKAAWDISHDFVPYCPSLAQLYAMIQNQA